jgi:hypothetical protein
MVDLKEAVQRALDYTQDLYSSIGVFDPLLEEVEISDNERYWLITIGFSRTKQPRPDDPLGTLPLDRSVRVYKVFKIRVADGKIMSMKIREPIQD